MSYAATKRGKAASKAAREAARREAERRAREEARRRRRNRILAALAAVVVVAVVATITVTQVQAARERARLTGPENMRSDGIVLYGDTEKVIGLTTDPNGPGAPAQATSHVRAFGIVDVKVYADYTDPDAAAFWAAVGEDLTERVAEGDVTVEIHAIGQSQAAVAAARALACVADTRPDDGLTAHGALLAAQDRLATATGADLAAILADAGITDDAVARCVQGDRFAEWVEGAIERAATGAVDTVIGPVVESGVWILDEPYEGDLTDAEAFGAALDAALEAISLAEEG